MRPKRSCREAEACNLCVKVRHLRQVLPRRIAPRYLPCCAYEKHHKTGPSIDTHAQFGAKEVLMTLYICKIYCCQNLHRIFSRLPYIRQEQPRMPLYTQPHLKALGHVTLQIKLLKGCYCDFWLPQQGRIHSEST